MDIETAVLSFRAYRLGKIKDENFTTIVEKYPLVRNFYESRENATVPTLIQPPTCGIDIFVLHGERASSIFSVRAGEGHLRSCTLLDFLQTFKKGSNEYNKRVLNAIKQSQAKVTAGVFSEEHQKQYNFVVQLLESII